MGFRGIVMTTDQLTLTNMTISGKELKNAEFRKVFEKLQKDNKIKNVYRNKPYYLFFVKMYDNDIMQCKLVRKTTLKKHDLGEKDIDETIIDDYPYVNVFVHLASQKFLVELNQSIFVDYETSIVVLQNIINTILTVNDCYINIQAILDDKTFWNFIKTSKLVYEVELILKAPNMFDVSDNADSFVRAIENITNAKTVAVKLNNDEGKLEIKKENIDTYVQYANAGGGEWVIKRKTKEEGKKTTIKSSQKCKIVNIPASVREIRKSNVAINIIINSFNTIEHFANFKIGNNDE